MLVTYSLLSLLEERIARFTAIWPRGREMYGKCRSGKHGNGANSFVHYLARVLLIFTDILTDKTLRYSLLKKIAENGKISSPEWLVTRDKNN